MPMPHWTWRTVRAVATAAMVGLVVIAVSPVALGQPPAGQDPTPSFADALQVQLVLDAVERSAAASAWVDVEALATV